MNDVIAWLSDTTLKTFITSHSWVWPSMEMIHFLGLCLLFGSMLIIDLRIIGMARQIPLKWVDRFIIFTLIGFALNVITGVLFVMGDPARYLVNIAFKVKMLLIILAGLNAVYFPLKIRPQIHAGATHLSSGAKLSAAISLILWTGVIILGRFIPYLEDI